MSILFFIAFKPTEKSLIFFGMDIELKSVKIIPRIGFYIIRFLIDFQFVVKGRFYLLCKSKR
ncbi:MAG: hypothetical protein DRR16_00670 [Candidatus Parabeggiatoa sp. nov. 3]|nr:MAG: hypothetical protein DRR16_00670 [Gammaproteobacteria bacterium]